MMLTHETVWVALREDALRDVGRLQGFPSIASIAGLCGISESYLHRLIKGERPCSWDRLVDIAARLRVKPTTIADVRAKAAA